MTTSARTKFSPDELTQISLGFEGQRPEEMLRWAFDAFGSGVGIAASFGGASGAVIMDMALKLKPDVTIFYLDTDFLFPETYAYIDAFTKRYGVTPVAYKSRLTPEQQAARHGPALWQRDPDKCCDLRKVEPNARALAGLSAWATGIRRDQSGARGGVNLVEWNKKFGLVKLNPVAAWTKKEVWAYIFEHKVPYNLLLDQGYKSIGCTHCTRAVGANEDERAGRWSGTDKTECGLHT
ncbi:MAG: phosphoadenylyl-sulfate reductase [Dehalococcoidia bacterium]|nr:phosphoadenylyl-sulfate reductase [Dehalococcoidia bacterium]